MAEHLAVAVVRFQIKPYRRQFRQPLRTAHGDWVWREGLLLRAEDADGRVGYGEVAPIPWFGSETLAEAKAFCTQLVANGRLSQQIPDRLSATQFGVDTAIADLAHYPDLKNSAVPSPHRADYRENPDHGINGQDDSLLASAICGLLPAGDQALLTWPKLWQQGTRTFKWKIGVESLPKDLANLEALAQQIPAEGRLRLDANGGLSLAAAVQWLTVCDRLKASSHTCLIEFLEQPLPPSEFEAMQRLSDQFQTAIALDESVATVSQLESHYHQGWRGLFVVKPAIAGSPHHLRTVWRTHAPRLVFSSTFETPVGRRAALDLAATYAQDLPQHSPLALGFGTLGWFVDDWDALTPAQLWSRL